MRCEASGARAGRARRRTRRNSREISLHFRRNIEEINERNLPLFSTKCGPAPTAGTLAPCLRASPPRASLLQPGACAAPYRVIGSVSRLSPWAPLTSESAGRTQRRRVRGRSCFGGRVLPKELILLQLGYVEGYFAPQKKLDAHLKLKMASGYAPPKKVDTPQKLKVSGGSGPPKRSTLPENSSRRSRARVRM